MSQEYIDVTNQVRFDNPDDECLPLLKCVCGAHFGHWNVIINMDTEDARRCPECDRKLFFRQTIRVFEIVE